MAQAGAFINAVRFKAYKNETYDMFNGLRLLVPEVNLVRTEATDQGFINHYQAGSLEIIYRFSYNLNYSNRLEITILNAGSSHQQVSLPIVLGRFDFSKKPSTAASGDVQDAIVSTSERHYYPNTRKDAVFPGINFIGMRNKHFAALIDPDDSGFSGFVKPFSSQLIDIGITSEQFSLAPGQQKNFMFQVYLGPQDVSILSKNNLSWPAIVYYGKFNFFAHILLSALKAVHNVVKSWGAAIIIVSILIYLVLFPLTLKGFKTMKLTQELKPKIDQLQAQYKGDPQKLNREMIELYKQHKINPLSGCLPFVLQIPLFGAFFLVLSRLIEIKGASFLWIKDLSEPDRLILMKNSLPFIGNEINLLPVIFLAISFIQQRFTPATSGASAEQQKIFMFMTPVILGVVFYHMPAGLLVYSCVNAGLMVMQMAFMAKKS